MRKKPEKMEVKAGLMNHVIKGGAVAAPSGAGPAAPPPQA